MQDIFNIRLNQLFITLAEGRPLWPQVVLQVKDTVFVKTIEA